jgi:hypothetical protein
MGFAAAVKDSAFAKTTDNAKMAKARAMVKTSLDLYCEGTIAEAKKA